MHRTSVTHCDAATSEEPPLKRSTGFAYCAQSVNSIPTELHALPPIDRSHPDALPSIGIC
jgi:hypothetical protein